MKKNSFPDNGVTAHRENSSAHPENTIAAFKSAIEIGADWIELDVRRTEDGHLIVIHDENTRRIGDNALKTSEANYGELKKIDAAFQFRKTKNIKYPVSAIPLLSEVFELIKTQNKTRVSVQPKENIVGDIMRLAEKMDVLDWLGFNDGNLELMTEVKTINSGIPVFWDTCSADYKKIVSAAEARGVECVVMYESYVEENLIKNLHEAGISAGAWTVDSPETMKRFFTMGIDRLYTDFPELCFQIKKLSDNR